MSKLRSSLMGMLLATGALAFTSPAQADVFTFTSCHLTGGCGTATSFGTVTLTTSGTGVLVDVVLTSGDRFVTTGAGDKNLFLFNDTVSGSTVTNATATLNGTTTTLAVSGATNQTPFQADGTGFFTAFVGCTNS